jgi:hypothetical protein
LHDQRGQLGSGGSFRRDRQRGGRSGRGYRDGRRDTCGRQGGHGKGASDHVGCGPPRARSCCSTRGRGRRVTPSPAATQPMIPSTVPYSSRAVTNLASLRIPILGSPEGRPQRGRASLTRDLAVVADHRQLGEQDLLRNREKFIPNVLYPATPLADSSDLLR